MRKASMCKVCQNKEEQDARAKREWESNKCEGCFSPLRDCVCELCEVCEALVTQCDCNRCEDCGTIYSAEDSAENLNEDNNCANCANKEDVYLDPALNCECGYQH